MTRKAEKVHHDMATNEISVRFRASRVVPDVGGEEQIHVSGLLAAVAAQTRNVSVPSGVEARVAA